MNSNPATSKPTIKMRIWMLVPVVALSVLLLLMPMPFFGRTGRALSDLLHAPCFAILAALFYFAVSKALSRNSVLVALISWSLLAGFGIGTEYLQVLVGRTGNLQDASANVLGITAGILLVASGKTIGGWRRTLTRAVGILLILTGLAYPTLVLFDVFLARHSFPQLASFEQPLELWRWDPHNANLSRSTEHATNGTMSGRLDLMPARYSGAVLTLPGRDWSAFNALIIDLVRADEPSADDDPSGNTSLNLVIKIKDRGHNNQHEDRFHMQLQLNPGGHTIVIPLLEIAAARRDRFMKLSELESLEIFAVRLARPTTVFVDNIRLE